MKFTASVIGAAAVLNGVLAAPVDETATVMSPAMARLRALKEAAWSKIDHVAAVDVVEAAAVPNSFSPCVNGVAADTFPCNGIDLYGYMPHTSLGSARAWGSDIWGWVSPEGREIVVAAQYDGTGFLEINKTTGALIPLGHLNAPAAGSSWRDIKVIDGYAYIGTEARNSGLQVFDLRKVLNNKSVVTYTQSDLTAQFNGFSSSHNIVANEEKKTIYAVGSNTCSGGLFAIDVSTPSQPRRVGCYTADGYTHDSQCVTYKGPDTRYVGKPICFSFNEDTLTITDHSNEASVVQISRTGYPTSAYTHQGWFIDEKQDFLISDDELDEEDGTTGIKQATTYIWDVTSLTRPVLFGRYGHVANSIDHNVYVKDGFGYHSNYGSGLRVVDYRNVRNGVSNVKEVAYFDVYPEGDPVDFFGTWSNYPYFPSGFIVVNSMERGVFSLKMSA